MSTGFVMMPQMIKSQCTELSTVTGRNLPTVVRNSGKLATITNDYVQLSNKGGALKKAGIYGAIAAGALALGSLVLSAFNKNEDVVKSAE